MLPSLIYTFTTKRIIHTDICLLSGLAVVDVLENERNEKVTMNTVMVTYLWICVGAGCGLGG